MRVPQRKTETRLSDGNKIGVALVVGAALIATGLHSSKIAPSYASRRSRRLKGIGSRNLQVGGNQATSAQGITTSVGNVNLPVAGGTGSAQGNGEAVGVSSSFLANSQYGLATSMGIGGGNSSANAIITVIDATAPIAMINSIGVGQGVGGGMGFFGPSLAGAVRAAATPPPGIEMVEIIETNSKDGGDKAQQAAQTVADVIQVPEFTFTPGLPTGGGAVGAGTGSGGVDVKVASTVAGDLVDEAYGSGLGNGFGFGIGSGYGVNAFGESAGGQGGGTALGQGSILFELDEAYLGSFQNVGNTVSVGGGSGFVGYSPPAGAATDFFDFLLAVPNAPTFNP